ncbi:MAG TPA: alpha/beta fold hydrolase [Gemmatimonadaceae bacterium]
MNSHLAAAVTLAVTMSASCAPRTSSRPEPIEAAGIWEGTARTGEVSLPLTVTIDRRTAGWAGTVDVPSLYALEYPLTDLRVTATTVAFSLPGNLPSATFEGVLEQGRLQGRFTSLAGPDTLRGTFELWRRPGGTLQYVTESVRFGNGDLDLAGTILRPSTNGSHPAIVLVHGSGPQTRDSYLRWFADQFARAGFVALIYDKRGTGESGGERWPQTVGSFDDLADDAVAGARFLADRPYVEADRIGIWGLSQGAWIGPLAAARAPTLFRFVIMVAGGGVSPAEQELYDDEARLRDLGFERAEIEEALAYLRLADQYVRTGSDADWSRFASARGDVRDEAWYSHLDRFPQILPREAPAWSGLRADLDYDPAPVLATVQVPALLILGVEDRLTPALATAERARRALENGGNRDVTVRLLPGADHALLTKPDGLGSWLAERPAANWVADMIAWALERK